MYLSEPKQRTPPWRQIFQLSGKEKSKSLHKSRTVVSSTLSKMKLKNYESKSKWKRMQLITRDNVTKTASKL